jgi:WD40 repeat protein
VYSREKDVKIELPGHGPKRRIQMKPKPDLYDLQVIDNFDSKSSEWRRSNNIIYFTKKDDCTIVWLKENRFLLQDMKTKSIIESFDSQHDVEINHFQQSPSGEYFLTADVKNNVMLWDSETLHIVQRYTFPYDNESQDNIEQEMTRLGQNTKQRTLKSYFDNQNVHSVAWSPCERFFAVGGINRIKIFDFTGKLDWSMTGTENAFGRKTAITNISYSPDGQLLAAACDCEIKVWHIKTKTLVWHNETPHTYSDFKGKTRVDKVNHLGFSYDGSMLFSSSDNTDK